MGYFVYGIADPRNDEIYYIGISNHPDIRLKQHISSFSSNYLKEAWLDRLRSVGVPPKIIILEELDSRDQAEEREKYWIARYYHQGAPLTNISQLPTIPRNPEVLMKKIQFPPEFKLDLDHIHDEWVRLLQEYNNPTGEDLKEFEKIFMFSITFSYFDEIEAKMSSCKVLHLSQPLEISDPE